MKRRYWQMWIIGGVWLGLLCAGWSWRGDALEFKNNPTGCKIWATTDSGNTVMNFKDDNNAAGVTLSNLASGASVDHGDLTGLTDNDHTQYLYKSTTTTEQIINAPVSFRGSEFEINGSDIIFNGDGYMRTADFYILSGAGTTAAYWVTEGSDMHYRLYDELQFTTDVIYVKKATGSNNLVFYDPVLGVEKTLSQLAGAGFWETSGDSEADYYRLADVNSWRVTSGGITQIPDYLQIDWDGTGGDDQYIYFGPIINSNYIRYNSTLDAFVTVDGVKVNFNTTANNQYAIAGNAYCADSSHVPIGIIGSAQPQTTGIEKSYGVRGNVFTNTGYSTTNAYSVFGAKPYGGGVTTNAYAGYFELPTVGTALNYSVYAEGDSYFGDETTTAGTAHFTAGLDTTTVTASGLIDANGGIDATTATVAGLLTAATITIGSDDDDDDVLNYAGGVVKSYWDEDPGRFYISRFSGDNYVYQDESMIYFRSAGSGDDMTFYCADEYLIQSYDDILLRANDDVFIQDWSGNTRIVFDTAGSYIGPNGDSDLLELAAGLLTVNGNIECDGYMRSETSSISKFTRTTADTNNTAAVFTLKRMTTNNMTDGFGASLYFAGEDSQGFERYWGIVEGVRDGADTEGALQFKAGTNGDEQYMTIDADGNVSIDAGDFGVAGDVTVDKSAGALDSNLTLVDDGGDDRVFLKTVAGDGYVGAGATPTANIHGQAQTEGGAVALSETVAGATTDNPNFETRQYDGLTTDGTVTTIGSLALDDDTIYLIEARYVARRTGGAAGTANDGAAYVIRGCFKSVAPATVTVIGSLESEFAQESQGGWDATIATGSGQVDFKVTGATNNNVSWHCTVQVQKINS